MHLYNQQIHKSIKKINSMNMKIDLYKIEGQ